MRKRQGLTLVEVLLAVVVIVIVLFLLLAPHGGAREEARRVRCRNNLNQLAKGMVTYVHLWYPFPLGRGLRADDFNGAEWLASLYWTGVVPDPGVFICPSSPDTNESGRDLGTHRAIAGRFGSETVSYAGMHYRSLTDTDGSPKPGAIKEYFPPNLPMACDDTQGAINHGQPDNGYMSVLFFDSHVEGRTNTELDVERAVGQRPGLLAQLRN